MLEPRQGNLSGGDSFQRTTLARAPWLGRGGRSSPGRGLQRPWGPWAHPFLFQSSLWGCTGCVQSQSFWTAAGRRTPSRGRPYPQPCSASPGD